ncbi:MAG: hypothetical protein M3Y56_12210 [Armatimonadota bacterium]|nr:hypothetical protein [Armatimonadota bacterium]
MKLIYSAALLLTSLAAVTPIAALEASGSEGREIPQATARWQTDIQSQNFSDLRRHLQAWAAPDFSFNTAIGIRAIDRLIESERNGVDSVRKAQAHFGKEYNVKLHSSIHFETQTIQLHGDTLVQTARLSYQLPATGKKKMPNGMVQGEAGDLGHSEVYHITWTRTPFRWKLRSLKILPYSMIGTALFIEQAKNVGAANGNRGARSLVKKKVFSQDII